MENYFACFSPLSLLKYLHYIIQKIKKINIHYYLFHIYIRRINYLENYMNNVNENKKIDVKLIKHFIKDLSFENPQKY